MRCIFIVSQAPISPNYRGGGAAIYYEQLASLAALGHEIHLWHYAYPDARAEFARFVTTESAEWGQVKAMCKSVNITDFPHVPDLFARINNRLRNWLSAEEIRNPLFRALGLPMLKQLISDTDPHFIWAQHFGPAQMATLQTRVPVIYSFHDWLHSVQALRGGSAADDLLRQAEVNVARKASAVVCGSAPECEDLRKIGCSKVAYIPVAYDSVPLRVNGTAGGPARIVHLGGIGTTANRVGLQRFFDVVWPQLSPDECDLWIVGDMQGASSHLATFLSKVNCTGYVKDLDRVLHPYDLHIIPWEHNTGQRTRMAQAFNYSQVVVAVRDSVACFPEAKDGENCRLVERLDQMGPVLKELLRDAGQRKLLGKGARRTFETSFTRKALLPRYSSVIASEWEH